MLGESEYAARLALLTAARAGDPAAILTLAEKYKVRIGGMCHVEQEATMKGQIPGEPRPCPKCGKALKPNGYGPHVARCQANVTGDTTRPVEIHVRTNGKPLSPETAHALRKMIKGVHKELSDDGKNGCDSCLFRGLERHLDQELVAEAVRGGMGLAAAAAFVRRVRETR